MASVTIYHNWLLQTVRGSASLPNGTQSRIKIALRRAAHSHHAETTTMKTKCQHKKAERKLKNGPAICTSCKREVYPRVCDKCDGRGIRWSKDSGWHDCPDCDGGIHWIGRYFGDN